MLNLQFVFISFCFLCVSPSLAYGSFVYVTNYSDGTVSQFRANSKGMLTPLNPPSVKAWPRCHSLAADPKGRFLYVTSARDWKRRDCVISQFQIAPDGRLRPLTPAQVLVPGTPATVVVAPSGRFVYVFNREGTAAQFRIGADGGLSPLPSPIIHAANAGGIVPVIGFDRRRHLLYGSYTVGFLDTVLGGTFAFTIRDDGQLLPLPGSGTFYNTHQQTVSPPYSLSLSPNGQYAYLSESLYDKHLPDQWRDVVAQYRTRSNGVLVPLLPKTVAVELAGQSCIDPKGRFLYLLGAQTFEAGGTARYRIGYAGIHRNGVLGQFDYQTLAIPAVLPVSQAVSLTFDPAGRFCCLADGNCVYLFHLYHNGSLSPLRPSKITAGNSPLGINWVHR